SPCSLPSRKPAPASPSICETIELMRSPHGSDMSRIHLLTPSIIPGDAVSSDVLGMRRWLRRRGHEAHAYAGRCHEDLRKKVRPLRTYRKFLECRDDVVIYHHSVGWPAGMALYEMSRNRKVVRYHNVTPAAFYQPYNASYVRACLRGVR